MAHHLEQGLADVIEPHFIPEAPSHPPPPAWLVRWEAIRPRFLMELLAEAVGVFLYTYFGVGATAAFVLSAYSQTSGIGSLFTIGLAYGFGICFAVIAAAPTSGGHLSTSYTLAFAVFRGFPWRKVPFFILAQFLGGFIGALMVYAQYRQQFVEVHETLVAAGPAAHAVIFSPQGPAGILAIFPAVGQKLGYVVLNEFVATTILAFLVATILDPSNFFITISAAPLLVGLAYATAVWAFAFDTVALNTARDLGGRFACAVIYGTDCFPKKYSAIAALTNIPGTLLGFFLQSVLFMDSNRPIVTPPPAGSPEMMALKRKATAEYAASRKATTQSTSESKLVEKV